MSECDFCQHESEDDGWFDSLQMLPGDDDDTVLCEFCATTIAAKRSCIGLRGEMRVDDAVRDVAAMLNRLRSELAGEERTDG